jgi:hypothetical protein
MNDFESRRAVKEVNAQREMPGEGDWVLIRDRLVPSYILTPTGHLVGFEFNEYNGLRGYYYREITSPGLQGDGSPRLEMGPAILWDQGKVMLRN